MKYFIPSIQITDAQSPYNGVKVNVLWCDGIIEAIGPDVANVHEYETIEFAGAFLSAGWFDLHTDFGTPGHEDAENLLSGSKSAQRGGFTDVVLTPSTSPTIDHSALVRSLLSQSAGLPIQLHVAGAATRSLEGQSMSEVYDMQQAGALAITTDKAPCDSLSMLVSIARYAKQIEMPFMVFPYLDQLSQHGWVHEGRMAIKLGLRGIPSIAESAAVDQWIQISAYYSVPIHLSFISTADGVQRIRAAKANGIPISADVAMANLLFNEEVLQEFDTRFKVLPPIRSEEDRKALIEGVIDGTLDAITSDHRPQTVEAKKTSFQDAAFGMTGLEFCFPALNEVLDHRTLVQALTAGRGLMGLAVNPIEKGYCNGLTLYSAEDHTAFEHSNTASRSKNSPLYHRPFKGKVWGTLTANGWHPNKI